MRCPWCNAENPGGIKFCGQCGAPLAVLCPVCGHENPPGHRFCGNCATVLVRSGLAEPEPPEPYAQPHAPSEAPPLPGEIKRVTVLFCDIVGSTRLTEQLGAEGMQELVHSFIKTSLAEVRRYGGATPQFRGDGFMALFGAPLTQEDHVRRALLAALAIQRRMSAGTVESNGLDLPVRIGVHTGPVVFGPVADQLSWGDTVIGDTANVAARLEEAAEPGTIVISDETARRAEGYARVEPVGPLALKGKASLIDAYRLLGVTHWRAVRVAGGPERTTSFVDRVAEVALLQNYFKDAESGLGRVVGIVGEPGIGKSRLLEEVRRRLVPGRFTWLEGRCHSYGTAIPYQLVLDLLRASCGIVETDTREEIAAKVRAELREVGMDPDQDGPVLLQVLEIETLEKELPYLRPEALKQKTFEVFRQLAVKGSLRRPLVLVLEDLHWTDSLSAEFVEFLAESVAGNRILLLAAYRPEFHVSWIDKSYAAQIPLPPLSPSDSREVVRSMLPQDALGEAVTQEILAKADGNPLFIEQLARHADEAKTHRFEHMVPATIHDVVMARIDRLPEAAKRLLQTAAVIGREFSLRLLRAVWPEPATLETVLRELCRLEFLDARQGSEGTIYAFRHWLAQEAAYGSLLGRQRRARHGLIGQALEALYAERTEEVAELLALHFGRSDEAEKAVDYAILAAGKAQRRWANDDAVAYFNDALSRLDALPDNKANRLRRIDAVLKQAEVRYALGQYTEHIFALEKIRSIIEEAADPRRRAEWHYWSGFLHGTSGGRPEVAIEHCRTAAGIAFSSGLHELNAFALACLAQAYMVAARLGDAIEAGETALSNFEARGDRWWAGRTLWLLSSVANYRGEWGASLAYCRRGLDHGIALDDLRLKAAGWTRIGNAHLARGDTERALECCDRALALSPLARDAAWARAVRGYGRIRAGDLDQGIAEMQEALAWFESSHMRWTQVIGAVWLAEGHLRRGDRATAQPLIDRILNTSRTTGYLQYEGRGCWLMAECLARDAPLAAEDFVDTAIRIFQSITARNDLAKAMLTRAALQHRRGDGASAKQLLADARAIFAQLGTLDDLARTDSALAALDRALPVPFYTDIAPPTGTPSSLSAAPKKNSACEPHHA